MCGGRVFNIFRNHFLSTNTGYSATRTSDVYAPAGNTPVLLLLVSNTAGTPTLTAKIQGSYDGGKVWEDVVTVTQNSFGVATGTASAFKFQLRDVDPVTGQPRKKPGTETIMLRGVDLGEIQRVVGKAAGTPVHKAFLKANEGKIMERGGPTAADEFEVPGWSNRTDEALEYIRWTIDEDPDPIRKKMRWIRYANIL